jgi:CMP-N,N'-diacetyllegionaminic acid synthase
MEIEKNDLDVWAVILARGGSKRLKNKNKRSFLGKPLVLWTVVAAFKSGVFSKVVLSSDDEDILTLGRVEGAEIRVRPEKLAMDDSPSSSSVIDAIDSNLLCKQSPPDIVCLLQPTSPLRTAQDIRDAWEVFGTTECSSLVSVSENHIAQDKILPNGAIYFRRYADLKATGSFVDSKTRKFGMTVDKSIDIDLLEDFELAEMRAIGSLS